MRAMLYQMTAKKAQEQTKEAKKLKRTQVHDSWMDEMNKSFRILQGLRSTSLSFLLAPN